MDQIGPNGLNMDKVDLNRLKWIEFIELDQNGQKLTHVDRMN